MLKSNTNMSTRIQESGAFIERKSNDDGLIPIRIITEGKGSSGTYSRELLESHAAVFSNALSYMNHAPDPQKPWTRDVETIAGRIKGETFFTEANGVAEIRGWYKPDPKYKQWFEEYGDAIGLSVNIGGESHTDANGDRIVESFDGSDPYRSVDVVAAAGRGGRFERAVESLHEIETSEGTQNAEHAPAAPGKTNSKESSMEIEELLSEARKVTEAMNTALVEFRALTESLKPQPKSEDQLDKVAVERAAVDAGLPESLRNEVQQTIESLTQPEALALVEEKKRLVESIREDLKKSTKPNTEYVQGRVVESNQSTSDGPYVPKQWKKVTK